MCMKLHFSHLPNWVCVNTSHNSFTVFPPATLNLGADTNQIIMRVRQLKVTDLLDLLDMRGSRDSAETPGTHWKMWS